MQAYLDNSATTAVNPQVAELVLKIMTEDYGNPSSMHRKGFEAEGYIREAAATLSGIWNCSPGEVIFTSGGTESDNMAIIGAARAGKRRGRHIITSRVEHAAVLSACEYLKGEGYEISYLDTDREGIIDLSQLEELIREDTLLVSLMHVNNEIGSIMPVEEAGRLIKKKNPGCLFHIDDIQGFGKLRLLPGKCSADMISISGHKLHGPKGTGALYVNKNARISPIIFGGGQQKGRRSGTENVPGIAGLALAAKLLNDDLLKNQERLYALRENFINSIRDIEGVSINGPADRLKAAPHIVSVSVQGIRAEVLLHALEDREIFVSAGSACASNKPQVSATLQAIGLDRGLLDSTIRFSFSVDTGEEEIAYAADTLRELLPGLRRFTRK